MTPPNRHRIQRQVVELVVAAAAEGPAVHRELARPFWDRAVADLEKVFDSAAGPGQLLRLDRLELDLGTLAGGDWPAEFRRKLVAEFSRTLAQFTPAAHTNEHAPGTEPADAWRQFLFFLAHGRLPWWAGAPLATWTATLSNASSAQWNSLRETIRSDPRARARLVYSVNDHLLQQAITNWCGVPNSAQVLAALTPNNLAPDSHRQYRHEFWTVLFEWFAAGDFRSPLAGPQLVRHLIKLRDSSAEAGPPPTAKPEPHETTRPAESNRTATGLELPEPSRTWHNSQSAAPPVAHPTSQDRAPNQKSRAAAEPASPPAASQKTRRTVEDKAIYLPGAGVILLHPFLERLFRERALLEGRNFLNPAARARAVHIIAFLTFGRQDVPEYDLVLAKILCGIQLEEPLPPVQLDEDDLAACHALLGAVLEHWTALRSTSSAWLRQQFFLREGKLEPVDAGWLLTLERHAQDVLLARLPWGFGVIALPWLKPQVFVHWLD